MWTDLTSIFVCLVLNRTIKLLTTWPNIAWLYSSELCKSHAKTLQVLKLSVCEVGVHSVLLDSIFANARCLKQTPPKDRLLVIKMKFVIPNKVTQPQHPLIKVSHTHLTSEESHNVYKQITDACESEIDGRNLAKIQKQSWTSVCKTRWERFVSNILTFETMHSRKPNCRT